jgi:hypothetical protein
MPGHTRLPTSESTALRLARASTINSHTPDADCTRRPLLSGARRYARRYGGAPSARAPYRDQTQRRSRDLRATEAPSPSARRASPFAFVKVSRDRVRSVRRGQIRRNVDIVVHLFNQHFLLLHRGEEGWGGMVHARYVVVDYLLRPPMSIPILCTPGSESGLASIAFASAPPNRPSSMKWRAKRVHDLRVACRLGARSNLPAPSGNRRR